MKMMGHQAITENISIFFPLYFYFLQKIEIIGFSKKDGLLIIAPVVNMIDLVGFEMHSSGFTIKFTVYYLF
jgi:uncharacterized protein YdhG (YjbR/CyaY superfamily)